MGRSERNDSSSIQELSGLVVAKGLKIWIEYAISQGKGKIADNFPVNVEIGFPAEISGRVGRFVNGGIGLAFVEPVNIHADLQSAKALVKGEWEAGSACAEDRQIGNGRAERQTGGHQAESVKGIVRGVGGVAVGGRVGEHAVRVAGGHDSFQADAAVMDILGDIIDFDIGGIGVDVVAGLGDLNELNG